MKTITINQSKQALFKVLKGILSKNDLEVNYANLSQGIITAKKSSSLLSFGNDIKITIKEVSLNKCNIKVSASSASPIQLISWGVNDDIEDSIIEELVDRYKS